MAITIIVGQIFKEKKFTLACFKAFLAPQNVEPQYWRKQLNHKQSCQSSQNDLGGCPPKMIWEDNNSPDH